MFCSESDGQFLNASTFEMEGGVTDLRLNLTNIEDYSPCDDELMADRGSPRDDLFPPLSAPTGAQQQGGGGGGGGRTFYTSADLNTTLSVQEVNEHYRQQLSAGGWTTARKRLLAGAPGASPTTTKGPGEECCW